MSESVNCYKTMITKISFLLVARPEDPVRPKVVLLHIQSSRAAKSLLESITILLIIEYSSTMKAFIFY